MFVHACTRGSRWLYFCIFHLPLAFCFRHKHSTMKRSPVNQVPFRNKGQELECRGVLDVGRWSFGHDLWSPHTHTRTHTHICSCTGSSSARNVSRNRSINSPRIGGHLSASTGQSKQFTVVMVFQLPQTKPQESTLRPTAFNRYIVTLEQQGAARTGMSACHALSMFVFLLRRVLSVQHILIVYYVHAVRTNVAFHHCWTTLKNCASERLFGARRSKN